MPTKTSKTEAERDYSGVPSRQLAAVIERYRDRSETQIVLAERIGINPRDLRKLITPGRDARFRIVDLGKADRVLTAMELNISALVAQGELEIVPVRETDAERIAQDEQWAAGITDLEAQMRRTDELRSRWREAMRRVG